MLARPPLDVLVGCGGILAKSIYFGEVADLDKLSSLL